MRVFAVHLHTAGLSLRETAAILGLLGVDRSHQAIWQWTHRLADSETDSLSAQPSRVAVDETAVKIDGEWCWLYAAIDLDTMVVLDVEVFGRHGTDPTAAFLIDSSSNMMSPIRCFSPMGTATRQPSLDSG